MHPLLPGSPVLVYNRVPKCASTTISSVMRAVARRNGFTYHGSQNYWGQVLGPEEEAALVASLEAMAADGPILFDRHFYVLVRVAVCTTTQDFARHPGLHFEWINFVREPVGRVVSMFHYLRRGERWAGGGPEGGWREKELDSCVLQGDLECQVRDLSTMDRRVGGGRSSS